MTRHLLFDFLTYWQIGSGLGEEAAADSIVARDESGLPVLPGRTLKGLLRDAMELAGIPPERIEHWFGSKNAGIAEWGDEESDVRLEQSRFKTKGGTLWFSSAYLPDAWRAWARPLVRAAETDLIKDDLARSLETRAALFRYVASTSIDADGVARDKTLRVAEVTVPMRLRSRVEGPAEDVQWIGDLNQALPLLRAIGVRRHRGYGRVRCVMEEI